MTLLHPIYLWSLFLLAIPLAVHLLSKNNPTRIKIGSAKFLERTESRRFRRLKFQDAGLFALRALIVALLALWLSSPEIACEIKTSERGWILIDPTIALENQPLEFHRTMDSLTKAGYEIRRLESGFPMATLAEKKKNVVLDIWSLLAEADKANRDTLAFFVASPRKETFLQGKRPTLSRRVEWIETTDEDAIWIERIAQFETDSLLVAIGLSSPSETRFEHLVIAIPDKAIAIAPIECSRQGDSVGVALLSKPNEKKWFSLSSADTWRIVYDERYAETLPYLERAAKTIARFAPKKIIVETQNETAWRREERRASSALTIWLCQSEPPKRLKLLDATGFAAESFFDEAFIRALSETLIPEPASENDARKVASDVATPNVRRESRAVNAQRESLAFPIWILATLLVGLERWIAFSKE